MLAQGQSSAKRGGLAVVSSGLIFLKKKKPGGNKTHGFCFMWERQKATSKKLKGNLRVRRKN